jgi:phytoene synthase
VSGNAPSAEEITRASKSNLALAFIVLPRERRRDISTFYAFCRVIDDIADDPERLLANAGARCRSGDRRSVRQFLKSRHSLVKCGI